MIDRDIKQCLGQMIKGVQVIGAAHGGVRRAYTSHWFEQVSFEEPIVMASVSPKHDTYPLMVEAGRFAVSILAADQIVEGQYFSYPGRKFHYVADEYLTDWPGRDHVLPVVPELDRLAALRDVRSGHDGRPRVAVRPGGRGHAVAAEGTAAALLEPARVACHRRQGSRAGREHPRSAARQDSDRRLKLRCRS